MPKKAATQQRTKEAKAEARQKEQDRRVQLQDLRVSKARFSEQLANIDSQIANHELHKTQIEVDLERTDEAIAFLAGQRAETVDTLKDLERQLKELGNSGK